MDADAGGGVHEGARCHLGLDGGIQHSFLLLQVEDQAQFRQGQTGRPGQAEHHVVEVHGVTPQPPVMGRT